MMVHTSDMETHDILAQIDKLYQEHMDRFAVDNLPDFVDQRKVHDKLFALLAEKKGQLPRSQFQTAISEIMEKNKTLQKQALLAKQGLAKKIQSASKGRKALAGYGLLDRRSRPPRVMSFTE
jgi:dTDP-D-glucose 4,6-dehydratase